MSDLVRGFRAASLLARGGFMTGVGLATITKGLQLLRKPAIVDIEPEAAEPTPEAPVEATVPAQSDGSDPVA